MLWIILLLTITNTVALVLLIMTALDEAKINDAQFQEVVRKLNHLEYRVNATR